MKKIKMELLTKKLENFWAKFFSVANVYEINHIWELRKLNQMKNDRRSCERDLYNCVREDWKIFRIQGDLNPWPRDIVAKL